MTEETSTGADEWRFDDLRALYVNCTLRRSPEPSHTQGLLDRERGHHGAAGGGRHPAAGRRPLLQPAQRGRPVRLRRPGGWVPAHRQRGRDKHCARNLRYSLQHLGDTIPPQADAGWIGEAGPGPSYLDPGSGGPDNDFTNRNTSFATWNLLHLGALLKRSGGIPAHGNQRSEWDAGCRFDHENPEHR